MHSTAIALLLVLTGCGHNAIDADPDGKSSGGSEGSEAGTGGDDTSTTDGVDGTDATDGADGAHTGDAGGGGDTGDGTTGCAGLREVSPADGELDAYWLDPLRVTLDRADDTTGLALTDASGSSLAMTVTAADTTYTFQPVLPLSPLTRYVAALAWCDGAATATWAFTTNALGEPLTGDIRDQTYVLDFSAARWVQPEGIGALVGSVMAHYPLLTVESFDATTLNMLGSTSEDGTSVDFCLPTQSFAGWDFSGSPGFTGTTDATWWGGLSTYDDGHVLSIEELLLTGTFTADASAIERIAIAGGVDLRTLGDFFSELLGSSDPDEVCTIFESFGVRCEACASDGLAYCLPVEVTHVRADRLGEVAVHAVEAWHCDPECDLSSSNPDCDTSGW